MQYEQVAQTPIFTLKWSKRSSPLVDHWLGEQKNQMLQFSTVVSSSFSPVKENVLYYISGFLCRKIRSSITCPSCASALITASPLALNDHNCTAKEDNCRLTERKNRGGLIFASHSILQIVKTCEKIFAMHVLRSPKRSTQKKESVEKWF